MADKAVAPFRFDEPIYVLCEGPADVRLVTELLKREHLQGFSVNFAKGYQHFAEHVQGLTTSSDWRKVKRLLIVGDNDTKPSARWKNAHDALTGERLPAPDRHAQIADGTHGRPSTGIFMMPSADTAGALERSRRFSWRPSSRSAGNLAIACGNWTSAPRRAAISGTP